MFQQEDIISPRDEAHAPDPHNESDIRTNEDESPASPQVESDVATNEDDSPSSPLVESDVNQADSHFALPLESEFETNVIETPVTPPMEPEVATNQDDDSPCSPPAESEVAIKEDDDSPSSPPGESEVVPNEEDDSHPSIPDVVANGDDRNKNPQMESDVPTNEDEDSLSSTPRESEVAMEDDDSPSSPPGEPEVITNEGDDNRPSIQPESDVVANEGETPASPPMESEVATNQNVLSPPGELEVAAEVDDDSPSSPPGESEVTTNKNEDSLSNPPMESEVAIELDDDSASSFQEKSEVATNEEDDSHPSIQPESDVVANEDGSSTNPQMESDFVSMENGSDASSNQMEQDMPTPDPEEDLAQESTKTEEEEVKKLRAQLAAVEAMEEEEEEDLEEGEIEDDEEVPAPVTEKPKPVVSNSIDKEKESSRSSSKYHHHSFSSKDKDVKKSSRERESKSDKRRKQSTGSKEDSEKSPHHRDKSSKKRPRKSEDVSAGDDDYLFVRGASISPPPPQMPAEESAPRGPAGRKIYDTDPFGNPIYEDELEPTFPLSPEAKRRRKSRSPPSVDRRRRDEARGNGRRPNSARKDAAKPIHKSEQICAYYMQGKCQKSHEDCAFSHNAVPPRKMELCKFWMMDCCAKKEKCLYLHNDFPCKYYHTGLVCKQGLKNQCKFSHKPMNEVTKAVLLKHIETAPKEILGDFPRLNRQGALNLIAKMENRINGELKKQERERDEERRRTRWEQPTKDDENKLHELMEEAGLGNYYQETVEGASQPQNENHPRDRDHRKPQQQQQPGMGITPLMGLLPNQLPPMLPNQPHIVHNPTLANVLASLHIPSTTIQRSSAQDGKENHHQDDRHSRREDEGFRQRETRISPTSPPHNTGGGGDPEPKNEEENALPDNLPPMQRGIFRRLQEQQLKNEKKIKEEASDDEEKPDDRGWYSSDDESDKPLTDVLKEIPGKAEGESKPVVDFASVLSAIRKTTAASSTNDEPDAKRTKTSTPSPQLSAFTGRGDVDFRIGAGGGVNSRLSDLPSSSQGPFRDTDFRVPPVLRQEFKDVDLRMNDSPPRRKSPPPSLFKALPTGPATMIDAAINSHPPMPWKVRLVGGIKPIDYNYIRHTLTPAQIAMDPRFGPRTAGGISLIPDPTSPPQQSVGANTPANIPGGDALLDPRMSRRMGQAASSGHLTSDPRLAGDQRGGPGGGGGPIPPNLLPPGWPPSVDVSQAALAAQLMAAQQLGLLPFPNPGGVPMMNPNFGDMSSRPPFPHGGGGRGSGPPASSWERYSQQQSGGVTPPL